MKFNCFILLIFSTFTVLFFRCNVDDICLSNQHAVQTCFFSMETKNKLAQPRTTIFGLEKDNDSIYRNENVLNMFLPLSFDRDTTSFLIKIQTKSDTIHFVHTKKLNFISRECGFTFDFVLDTVFYTNIFIDSVAIIYPHVKYNENLENVEIYIYN